MGRKEGLPTRLRSEPLVDILFEARFESTSPAAAVLPGRLDVLLKDEAIIWKKLPASDMPEAIRLQEPNLRYTPLIQGVMGGFLISLSDQSIIISCSLPYLGWTKFRGTILKVCKALEDVSFIKSYSRCSLRYIDLIPHQNDLNQASLIDISLKLGSTELTDQMFQVRLESRKDEIINIIQLNSSTHVVLNQTQEERRGLLVDVDTIYTHPDEQPSAFIEKLEERLNLLHHQNKETFFSCLTKETIKNLEPEYDNQ